jgi:outer membrane protein assembly factor BamB
VRLGGKGNITRTHEAWRLPRRQVPRRASPILVGGALYMVSDGGVMQCLDAATGEAHWRERLGGNFTASPLYAGDRLYFFNEEGACAVIRPSLERLDVEHTNTLDAGFMASPAVVRNTLILRTKTHLYRIDPPSR